MNTIYFRVDGNSDIATGHLMRCLTIARACIQTGRVKEQDVRIFFFVSDKESLSLLEERFEVPGEFTVYCLNSDYRRMEAEVPELLSHIAANTVDNETLSGHADREMPWLFIDSYYASPGYFHTLSESCKIAYLDDLRSFDCPVDLIINYDTDQDCSHYAKAARKLLGSQYTPLRAQFQSPSYDVRPEVSHVFFSTGGTDPYGLAEGLLYAIYNNPDCSENRYSDTDICSAKQPDISRLQTLHYHIVTSKANTRYSNLCALTVQNSHIHLHENVSDMASLMASCDVAVSAGGTTLSELCTVGVPTISCLMADNQRTAIDNFAARGIIPCAGDIRSFRPQNKSHHAKTLQFPADTVLFNILRFLTDMSENRELRQKSSHRMRAFLDGNGAERIADALLSF